jgi:hypothetical protein
MLASALYLPDGRILPCAPAFHVHETSTQASSDMTLKTLDIRIWDALLVATSVLQPTGASHVSCLVSSLFIFVRLNVSDTIIKYTNFPWDVDFCHGHVAFGLAAYT